MAKINDAVNIESKEAVLSIKYTDKNSGKVKILQVHLPENSIVSISEEPVLRIISASNRSVTVPDQDISKLVLYIHKRQVNFYTPTSDTFFSDDEIKSLSIDTNNVMGKLNGNHENETKQ